MGEEGVGAGLMGVDAAGTIWCGVGGILIRGVGMWWRGCVGLSGNGRMPYCVGAEGLGAGSRTVGETGETRTVTGTLCAPRRRMGEWPGWGESSPQKMPIRSATLASGMPGADALP